MPRPAEPEPPVDWTLTTWEGSRREQLRRWAELPLDRTIAALEEMGGLAEALGPARAPTTGVSASTPGAAACASPALVRAESPARSGVPVEVPGSLEGASFWKMSGGGNDFVVFDDREGWFPRDPAVVVQALCARGLGVGADAVLLLQRPSGADADFRMTYYNADGGEAPMCGNGALCIARLARELGLGRDGAVAFETGAGLYRAELDPERPSRVRLAMRDPRDLRPSLPEIEALGYARAGFVDTGTPHLILLVEDLAGVDVAGEGPVLRRHPLFQPEGLNVNFVRVLGRSDLEIRTYERGVEAETLSCGTGATAAAILSYLWGLTEPPVVVRPPGGLDLTVRFSVESRQPLAFRDATLEGDARIVFEGRLRGGHQR